MRIAVRYSEGPLNLILVTITLLTLDLLTVTLNLTLLTLNLTLLILTISLTLAFGIVDLQNSGPVPGMSRVCVIFLVTVKMRSDRRKLLVWLHCREADGWG